jgi:hypothetical protein
MGRPRKNPIPEAVLPNPILKTTSDRPTDKQWMVYDLTREWMKPAFSTGTVPNTIYLEEVYAKAARVVELICNG